MEDLLKVLAGFAGTAAVLGIAVYVLFIVAWWKLFTKAGEKGWKSLVPIYNSYVYYKITWGAKWFWLSILVPAATIILGLAVSKLAWLIAVGCIFSGVVSLVQVFKAGKAYGYSGAFGIGLLLLPNLFLLIMAFSNQAYVGPAGKATANAE